MHSLEPLYNNVIVRPIELSFKTQKGMILVETQKPLLRFQTGEVMAVGKGMITPDGGIMPLHVKVGDIVLYLRGTGQEVKEYVDEEGWLNFKETDLVGIVKHVDSVVAKVAENLKKPDFGMAEAFANDKELNPK